MPAASQEMPPIVKRFCIRIIELCKDSDADMRSNERRCVALGNQDSKLLRIVPDVTQDQFTQKHIVQFQTVFFYPYLCAHAASQGF